MHFFFIGRWHATLSPCLLPSKVKLYPFQSSQAFTWETFTGNLNAPSLCQCFNFTVHSLHYWADTEGKNGCKGITEAEKRQCQLKPWRGKSSSYFFSLHQKGTCLYSWSARWSESLLTHSTKRKPFHTHHSHNWFIQSWHEKRSAVFCWHRNISKKKESIVLVQWVGVHQSGTQALKWM